MSAASAYGGLLTTEGAWMGLYLEEFTLNRPLTTRGRTVSEADIVTFAGISGDWNPLHVDEEFSKTAGYGGRIAHGPMSMSMAIGLMAQQNLIDGTALGLLGLQWDFKGPVRIGDTIHAVVTPVEKRPTQKPGRGIIALRFEVKNQHGALIQEGTATLLMKMKASRSA
jgi:acyl dehydratase